MTVNSSASQNIHQKACEVCLAPIPQLDSVTQSNQGYFVCRSFDCKRVMEQKSIMDPTLFKHHLEFQRKLIQQRQQKEIDYKRRVEKIKNQERQENQRILDQVLVNTPQLTRGTIHIVTIPSGISTLAPLSEDRKLSYITHLEDIIDRASTYCNTAEVPPDQYHNARDKLQKNELTFAKNPNLQSVCEQLCSMCKGGCCADGKEHAYLTVTTMRRLMDTNPDLNKDDILALYTNAIHSETIQGACINQTKTGCGLPRELRSDICNSYFCESLASHIDNANTPEDEHTLENKSTIVAIQRSNHYWNRFSPSEPNDVIDVALIEEQSSTTTSHNSSLQKDLCR